MVHSRLSTCHVISGRGRQGFRVQGSGFRVQGSGFRVQGSGFRVKDSDPLSSECGTYKTVKAIFWPWLSGKGGVTQDKKMSRCHLPRVRG